MIIPRGPLLWYHKPVDIRYIESFLTLTEELNFSKAARKVCVSQSAFSHQIALLESEFGNSLFHRNKRVVELTEFGKEFLPYARSIVGEYRNWEMNRAMIRPREERSLRIGFLCDLPGDTIPRAVEGFKSAHGDIDLNFFDRTLTGILTGLRENEFDCAFTMVNDADTFEGLRSVRLRTYPLCAVLHQSHPLAERDSISLAEIATESFIHIDNESYAAGTRQVRRLCDELGFEPRLANKVSQVSSLLSLVEFGMGIALVTSAAEGIAPKSVVFVPLEERDACSHLVVLWRCSNKNPLLPDFIRCAEELHQAVALV